MRPLNLSEKKVLTLLEQDCRMPASQLAKKARLSPEGVLKIIKRLEHTKVIKQFNTKLNYSLMGYKLYPVHIKLLKMNNQVLQKIKQIVSKHRSCIWHSFCEGEYDLLLSFKISAENDKTDMDRLLLEMSDMIVEKDISIVLKSFELSKSFVEGRQSSRLFKTTDHLIGSIDMPAEEMKILEMLRKNSRESVLNIADKTGMTARAVASRIKKMKKIGVISGFKTKINMAELNYQPCVALIRLGKCTEDDVKRFISYCRYTKGIHYLVRQIGTYDIDLKIDVSSTNDFYKLVDNIREGFSFVKNVTTLISKEGS